MTSEDHSRSGQGFVVLDVGEHVGALIVHAPACLAGAEIEIVPVGRSRDPQHVAVVARRVGDRVLPTAVFAGLLEGTYQLRRLPNGPETLIADVHGGAIVEAQWPRTPTANPTSEPTGARSG